MTDIKKIKRRGGPKPGTPSPLRGQPSPIRGRQFPHRWRSGPNPEHHALWKRFLVARNQARYWHQEWSVSWEHYRDTMLPHITNLGRRKANWNLVRIDRRLPWSETNVQAAQRETVVTSRKLGHRHYLPAHERERRRANMVKYKQLGYRGKRYKRYDNTD